MSGKEVIRKLEAEGWTLARIAGSHHIMQKNGKGVPVPVHGNKDIGKGLIAKIERETGVEL
jgi:predicted RNA binding protein YcfA (HicA-like mRNA interferase family)